MADNQNPQGTQSMQYPPHGGQPGQPQPEQLSRWGNGPEQAPRGDRESRRPTTADRPHAKPGLGTDLEMLDKGLGVLSQAVTALTKTLAPILGPEVPQAEPTSAAENEDMSLAAMSEHAPIRGRIRELDSVVAKLLRRVEELSARVEL